MFRQQSGVDIPEGNLWATHDAKLYRPVKITLCDYKGQGTYLSKLELSRPN